MAIEEHLARLKRGVEGWNLWRARNPAIQPDLSQTTLREARLQQADLHGANLSEAHLSEAHLSRANLIGANLIGANLRETNFSRADLSEANLYRVNLHGADLTGAILERTNLPRAVLTGANLTRARLGWTVFGDVDLSTTQGPEMVQHRGPSTIGINTLYRSQGNIPEVFLRGAGVSEEMITYSKSLVGQPFQYYSCFISYSSRDDALAQRLHADLQVKGVRCWFAPEDLKIGDEFRSHIDESIQVYDRLLLILSEYSVKSRWVQKEVETAFEKEDKENRIVLFPIRIDEAVMHSAIGWAADIRRQRYIGNFLRWKDPDAYQQAFNRLFRDLQADI
jgi:uncharacterized protein YjbI with pentapeptide repeats